MSDPIGMTCSVCEHRFRVRAEAAGKRVLCPRCKTEAAIPKPEGSADASEPSAQGDGRFVNVRLYASVCRVVGWLLIVLAIVCGVLAGVAVTGGGLTAAASVVGIAVTLAVSGFAALVVGELTGLALAVEQHLRQAVSHLAEISGKQSD